MMASMLQCFYAGREGYGNPDKVETTEQKGSRVLIGQKLSKRCGRARS
jgi:hypothetical protein